MKEFKVGEYYIFNANKKRAGKAKIHGLVEVNGIIHAVVSYRDDDDVSCIEARPVCDLKDRAAIFLLDAGFIYADAPVLPKVVKFKVGKKYYYFFDENDEGERFITARYKDPIDGRLKVVFGDDICEINIDQNGNEELYLTLLDAEVKAGNEVKE